MEAKFCNVYDQEEFIFDSQLYLCNNLFIMTFESGMTCF